MNRSNYLIAVIALALINTASNTHAQSLEPRAYANAPIGLNFLLVGYQNSTGGLVFDPAVPVEDAETDIDIGFLGFVHTMDVAGNSSKIGAILPYSSLAATGFAVDPDGNREFRTRDQQGLADPLFFFSMNFYGAPATALKDFKNYKQDIIVGFTFTVVPPLGVYDSSKLINIGTNRWTIKPGIGVSKAVGKWTLEASADVALYTDNNDFFNGQTREQDPIYSTQLHVTYTFPRNIWLAVSAT
ncbi:MAG: transporter, partial [Proteobacteria bacterium]|nr:transporter [Pseudomonadota bacterium]